MTCMNRSSLACIALLLGGLTGPLSAVPVAGSLRPVSDADRRPACMDQRNAAAATNGATVAIVWVHRERYILVARFDPEGRPLDPVPQVLGTPISGAQPSPFTLTTPAIAWIGSGYLIVWSEDGSNAIRGRMMSAEGAVGPELTYLEGESLGEPRIAVSANRVLVAAQWINSGDDVRGEDVHAAILDPAGRPVVQNVRLGKFDVNDWAVSGASSGFLLVGAHRSPDTGLSSVSALPIALDGATGTELPIAPPDRVAYNFDLEWNGEAFVAMWLTYLAGSDENWSVRTSRIDATGVGSIPQAIRLGSQYSGYTVNQALTRIGNEFMAIFGDGGKIFSQRLDAGGAVAGESIEVTREGYNAFGTYSAVAIGGRIFCVTGTYGREFGDIYGILLDDRGNNVSELPFWLATSPARQTVPAAARGTGSQLIAWREEHPDEGRSVIVAAILDDSGTFTAPIVLGDTRDVGDPKVASDGENFIIVWRDGIWDVLSADFTLQVARIGPTGQLLTARSIPLPPLQAPEIDIAWSGENFLIAFMHHLTDPARIALSAIRLSREGEPLDSSPFIISEPSPAVAVLALSLVGGEGRVTALYGGVPTQHSVVHADGSVSAPALLPFTAMSIDQADTMAAWIPLGVSEPDRIEWGRVSEHGVTPISSLSREGFPVDLEITISRMGAGFLLAWQEGGGTPQRSIVTLQLDENGSARSNPIRLHSDFGYEGAPELVGTPDTPILVEEAVDAAFGTPELTRVYVRTVIDDEPPRRRGVRR